MKLTHPAAAAAAAATTIVAIASAQNTTTGLLPQTLTPLPLGSILPLSWLLSELTLLSHGLAGAQFSFYTYVHASSWLGGSSEYSALNEALPYWLNGLVPLAYSLSPSSSSPQALNLKAQVHSAADYILQKQIAVGDGWLGPEVGRARNLWARFPVCLGLVQLAEANATGWEGRVVDGLWGFVGVMDGMLRDGYRGYVWREGDVLAEGDYSWGRVRSQDMMVVLQWLYERFPRGKEDVLLRDMELLWKGGLDWADWYNGVTYIKEDLYRVPSVVTNALYPYEHGVNVGQGLKAAAVIRRFTHNDSLIQTAMDGVNWTYTYHGAASGAIIADERLDGMSPYSGSELCTAVETMYSLSYLYHTLGNPYYADLCELTTFNALPAMLTPDYWGRQYMEQPNQPYSRNLSATPFFNTNSWGQTFGLEPNYPCCTVNHPQGLPKFLAATFVGVGANGVAHALLSPAVVETKVASGMVQVRCDTNYPFSGRLQYSITSDGAFDFYVRVPAWYVARTSSIRVGHGRALPLSPDPTTGLHKLCLPAGKSSVSYNLGSAVRVESRANDTVAVYQGALLYALEIGSTNSSTLPKNWANQSYYPAGYAPPQSRDWTMMNTSAWNVAIDPSTLAFHSNLAAGGQLASPIFAPGAPPTWMSVRACEIDWPLFRGSVPGDAPPKASRKCLGASFEAKLRPYGSAKLHMTELPTMDLSAHSYS